ncbi:MaoC/PaaZ C-terminal domain-containing protein [Ralstonia soli]|uniref:MaoC family dehydratase N-terminal domain-containing protein n=1 Tax=Ralstonia soli TaxID=2953896 RepID=A0ABT1AES7_9RALS|nr:MaoC/PaaZ C-terminal domain-containing protein [Ralstonia soli]MCO5396717.1 MaoC family dehydratase N-terminal domain-containing protein [Ralstonia soli]
MSTVEIQVVDQIGPNAKYYEELEVGTEWVTPRRTIAEADIVLFTAVTGDQNPVHTDEEFAKNSIFGARLLHGPAVFAIATGLEFRLGLKEGTAIAFLGMTWDMRGPVKAGDTLHVRERVTSKRETKKASAGIVYFHVAVENQRGEVVQEGEWKVMMKRKPGLDS